MSLFTMPHLMPDMNEVTPMDAKNPQTLIPRLIHMYAIARPVPK